VRPSPSERASASPCEPSPPRDPSGSFRTERTKTQHEGDKSLRSEARGDHQPTKPRGFSQSVLLVGRVVKQPGWGSRQPPGQVPERRRKAANLGKWGGFEALPQPQHLVAPSPSSLGAGFSEGGSQGDPPDTVNVICVTVSLLIQKNVWLRLG